MVKIKERHSNQPKPLLYELDDGLLERVDTGRSKVSDGLLGAARQVFLPEGYPDSVSEDYLEYQVWDTVQAFASSVSGSLATAAVLGGLGVGDSAATPLAATITWIMKDGAGMVGRIVFAAYTSTSLDFDCKRWRMFADILNDCVMCVELTAPALPRPLVMATLCVAGVGRSLVGVAGGATKAAVAQHQARRSNMADLAAKDGSQETLVNLLALVVNLILLPLVSDTPHLPFILFLVLAVLHVYSNYRAVSCLVFNSLNSARLNILLDQYLLTNMVEAPTTINKLEPVLRPAGGGAKHILLGVSLKQIKKEEIKEVEAMVENEDPYCILQRSDINYVILISNKASTRDIYQAYIQCYLQRANVDDIMKNISKSGWDLDFLALNCQGYILQHPV